MSVTNTKAKSVYNANGTTTEWNLGFTYDDTVSNVHIYIVDANDNETEITSNYSIADGVLTYPTTDSGLEPLAEGNKLVIVRDTPRTQAIELTSNGKLDGKVLEGGYDKLTLQVQELTEQVNRAIKFPVTEDSADNFLDPITAITEAKKEALVEIAQATTPAETAKDTAVAKAQVATEQATIATNAATSAKAAQVGAEQAEQNATAQAEKAENAVTAFVEGLGISKNAVIDLGTFYGKTSVTSSRIIEFDKKPVAVSLRFSDTNKKLWINGTNSTVGIEVIDNTHCNLFYSIASADFVGQNAVKGPFVVQAIIQYAVLDNVATETEMGAVQLATKAEAEAGTNDTKAMTPLKTKYAIEANATVQTLRNDIDDLGDQVSEIEAKIPQEASAVNQLATKEEINTGLSAKQDTISDLSTIREGAALGATSVQPEDLATVATSGSYNDLADKPTIPSVGNAEIEIQKNGTKVDSFTTNQATAKTINITVPTTAADVSALPASTKYGYAFDLSIDPNTYVVSLTMKDQDGTAIGTSQTIDLPLESVVVSGSYDSTNKKIVLTLQSGSTIDIPVGDLIAGLQTEITSTNKLSADLIADGTINKVVTETEKNIWNSKQAPISDLATIRSGAAAGATAVQPGDLATVATSGSYTDLTNKPTIPTVDSALSSTSTNAIQNKVVNTALAGKANATHTHTSGDITGLATVATSGMYNDLTGTPGVATADTLGLVKPDGNTITVTEDGTISATGGSGSGSGFDFEGTKAEFAAAVAAGTITEDSVSLITDDVSGDNVATKAELQAVDISKADTALSNVLANIDYVVESKFPTTDDPSWYRVYKSGWVEQGGYWKPSSVKRWETITFLKSFANTNYYVNVFQSDLTNTGSSETQYYNSVKSYNRTATSFKVATGLNEKPSYCWEAKGMGAN